MFALDLLGIFMLCNSLRWSCTLPLCRSLWRSWMPRFSERWQPLAAAGKCFPLAKDLLASSNVSGPCQRDAVGLGKWNSLPQDLLDTGYWWCWIRRTSMRANGRLVCWLDFTSKRRGIHCAASHGWPKELYWKEKPPHGLFQPIVLTVQWKTFRLKAALTSAARWMEWYNQGAEPENPKASEVVCDVCEAKSFFGSFVNMFW